MHMCVYLCARTCPCVSVWGVFMCVRTCVHVYMRVVFVHSCVVDVGRVHVYVYGV